MSAFSGFVGQDIKTVRWMTNEEMDKEGWEYSPRGVILEMVGGGKLYASADEEGNRAGALFGETADGQSIYLRPEEACPSG